MQTRESLDLTSATLVVREDAPPVERTAADTLREEIERRAGVRWRIGTQWSRAGWSVALFSGEEPALHGVPVPDGLRAETSESYALRTDRADLERPVLWIRGADPRGALFGVGRVLRNLLCQPGSVRLTAPLDLASAPRYPIRGHQMGYRATANSYDAWSPAQYERYIRELALFGCNSVENIPFQDDRPTVSPFPRRQMNIELSRICQKYGQDYWVWVPADFDMRDAERRAAALREHEALFRDCPVLSGVFVPGGDPGDNPADLVIAYMEEMSRLLLPCHPNARIWLSMQGFEGAEQDRVYQWIEEERPDWLGGLAAGPSSPPLPEMRARLPQPYAIRDYPDITHSVRCQFPVPYWDPAFAFTLGRECVNPRPLFFARVARDTAPFTDGFISYSDGVHDDVNKIVWSALAWDPDADIRAILIEYCRLFFGPEIAEEACDGILALERNWEGALATNGGVEATFALWQTLEQKAPDLRDNWRWQMCLLRACYDRYTRQRLLYETRLEAEANEKLLCARQIGAEQAIRDALQMLQRADTHPPHPELADRIEQLCEDLFRSIGLQTSVERYQASGLERGAVLDFLRYPLNNRWWLEDELAKAGEMASEEERIARLETLARWENPGPGCFYDDIGNIAKSPRVVRQEKPAGPLLDMDHTPLPGVMWWVDRHPLARVRQSWMTDEAWPAAIVYPAIDPRADYLVRTTGCGDCLLRVNGVRIAPTLDGRQIGEIKEFPIPRGLYRNGVITLTFDPTFEPHLNWRVQSRLTEVWLIKR
jgi:hypothetical protein